MPEQSDYNLVKKSHTETETELGGIFLDTESRTVVARGWEGKGLGRKGPQWLEEESPTTSVCESGDVIWVRQRPAVDPGVLLKGPNTDSCPCKQSP